MSVSAHEATAIVSLHGVLTDLATELRREDEKLQVIEANSLFTQLSQHPALQKRVNQILASRYIKGRRKAEVLAEAVNSFELAFTPTSEQINCATRRITGVLNTHRRKLTAANKRAAIKILMRKIRRLPDLGPNGPAQYFTISLALDELVSKEVLVFSGRYLLLASATEETAPMRLQSANRSTDRPDCRPQRFRPVRTSVA